LPLDPQAQAIADQFARLPRPDLDTLNAAAYRAGLAAFAALAPALDAGIRIDNLVLDGPAAPLAARAYRPGSAAPRPLVVYFHGGGFVSCGLDTHDALCSRLALLADAIVVSIDYRLAPEHPYPAAVDDAVAAVKAVHRAAATLGADPARIAVAGDSAGATLATVSARLMRDSGLRLAHQLLIYPVTDSACDTASHREHGDAPILDSGLMRWFWRQYLPNPEAGLDPRASPLRAPELAAMPPATVITAGIDPLRDEGEAYALALVAAGVPVTLRRWPGQFHGFASLLGQLDAADEALAFAAAQLRGALAR